MNVLRRRTGMPALLCAFARGALPALLWLLPPLLAGATEPPEPGMIARMRANGTLSAAVARAIELGNYEMRSPNHGAQFRELSLQETADRIMQYYGWALERQGKAALKITSRELSPAELDLNGDREVDERDVLALGYPRPKAVASLPSLGTVKVLCLFIDFPDYPRWFDTSEVDYRWFGEGDTDIEYRSLHWFYEQSSYGVLDVEGTVYQHRASHNRNYYHPDDNSSYGYEESRRVELLTEAIQALDQSGHDFSQYDNDGDGNVDYYAAVWTGPHGDWLTYWWPMCFPSYSLDLTVDGVSFTGSTLTWEWEQKYSFSESPPNPPNYSPAIPIHETGHALGLPDLYDYDDSQGPDGGVGHLDMMDGGWGDHNCFTKYILGWASPLIAYTDLDDQSLRKSNAYPDAVLFMPGFDPVTPWSEYFMAQYRCREGVDLDIPSDGMLLWHVDSRVTRLGGYQYNNSFTAHKMLRLMEADSLEEIENGDGVADAGDFYETGSALTPTSTPNSKKYDGSNTAITCDDFSAPGSQMTADFTMFTSNPPQVIITSPAAGSTVSGAGTDITIEASDDVSIGKVQLLIDGQLVKTWTSWSSPSTYSWNTLVDFNKTLTVTARAWDNGNQASSYTISVTVSNAGVTSITDGFESGFANWRVNNTPDEKIGTFTQWSVRTSPAAPPPLGSGNEAYVAPPSDGEQYACNELLRGERMDATAFSRSVRMRFYYRAWADGELRVTADNGNTWTTLSMVESSSTWSAFDEISSSLQGQVFYIGFFYNGMAESDHDALCAFNIDNVVVEELPSDPPSVEITSPQDGAVVSGQTFVTANASDDGVVTEVRFYLNNALVYTDMNLPWQYAWNTLNSDNHPALSVKAIAVDNDGLLSPADEIHVVLRNTWVYPVYEDLENNSNWTLYNYAPTPNWAWVSNKSHSGVHSYGWVLGGGGDGANYDSIQYEGRVDLAAASVDEPVIRILYTGDLPSDARVDAYFVNSWTGSTLLFSFNTDQAGWYEVTHRMDGFIGYSGRLRFYVFNSSIIGTGVWIDDLRVENEAPYITSITPNRGREGDLVHVNGMAFGFTREAGSFVTFGGGIEAADSDYQLWSNNQVQVRIPAGAVSGDATVTVGAATSNGVRVAVLLAPPVLQNLVEK